MSTIIAIISVIGILSFFYLAWMEQKVYKFRKNLKAGDRCKIYYEEERVTALVRQVRSKSAVVEVFGETRMLPIKEIYP